jgi:hypothetical protein
VRAEHLAEALRFLGHGDGDYRFEGVGKQWWPAEGHYVTEQDGRWEGGWTERGQRTALVQPADEDAAACWLFARLTNSLASDRSSGELRWTKPALLAAGERMARATAPMRAAAAQNPRAHARVTLRPGYVLDELVDAGVVVPANAAKDVDALRHLLVVEPLATDLSVLVHDEDPASVVVQAQVADVDQLVRDRVLQIISVDEQR